MGSWVMGSWVWLRTRGFAAAATAEKRGFESVREMVLAHVIRERVEDFTHASARWSQTLRHAPITVKDLGCQASALVCTPSELEQQPTADIYGRYQWLRTRHQSIDDGCATSDDAPITNCVDRAASVVEGSKTL